jgi:NADH dehydrogenase/NADH:ubiquinone oxidoreductase subunit G
MENINLKINGIDVSAPQEHDFKAAKLANIDIPTLCYLEESMK